MEVPATTLEPSPTRRLQSASCVQPLPEAPAAGSRRGRSRPRRVKQTVSPSDRYAADRSFGRVVVEESHARFGRLRGLSE